MKLRSASEIADALQCYRMKSERQRKNCKNKSCHYNNNDSYYGCYCCSNSILHDAVAMLKEQADRIGVLERAIEHMPKPVTLLDAFGNGYAKVVRCKDCKHYEDGTGRCDHAHGCAETWFCADGERR